MQTSRLVRACGIAGVAACVLGIGYQFLLPLHDDLADLRSGRWLPASFAVLVAIPLFAILLVGWHLRQADRVGTFGLTAFLVTLAGTVFAEAAVALNSVALRVLAYQAPRLVTGGIHAPFVEGTVVSATSIGGGGVEIVGLVLLAIATWRAGELPRMAGVLCAIGLPIAFSAPPGVVPMIGGIVHALGIGWIGIALLRTEREPALTRAATIAA